MKLIDNNKRFTMEVLDYEFPKAMDYYDANWLEISIMVVSDEKSWMATSPCLRTDELVELKEWFSTISSSVTEHGVLCFMENHLHFSVNKNNELLVHLDFDFHPNTTDDKWWLGGEYVLNFPLNMINIAAVIDSLSKSIQLFPEKFHRP